MGVNEINYTSKRIAEIVGGEHIGNNCEIGYLTIDSREKSSISSCFFALKGERFNGNNYIEEAISNGAKVIVTEKDIKCNASVIKVKSTREALGLLGKWQKGKTKVIGVTGSFGKTTVKDMIISILKEKYRVCGTIDNQNNEIGVAFTLLSCREHDYCVVEMGMRGRGEIEWLSYIAEPDISVVTCCASAHIGRLGDLQSIFLAKMEILKYTKYYGVLPHEERFLDYDCGNLKKVFFGEKTPYEYTKFKLTKDGQSFYIKNKEFYLNSVFEHDAANAAIAYAVGELCGLNEEQIAKGLLKYRKRCGRGEIRKCGNLEVINDCYNASYESTKSAIINASSYCKSKGKGLVVLLGDMLELGEKSNEIHYKIGCLCKELSLYKMLVYGEYAEYYLMGNPQGQLCTKFEELTKEVLKYADKDCILLIKASHGMNFQKIVDEISEIKNA